MDREILRKDIFEILESILDYAELILEETTYKKFRSKCLRLVNDLCRKHNLSPAPKNRDPLETDTTHTTPSGE